MSPLELSRVSAARPAVLYWARIARDHATGVFPTLDGFLAQEGQATVAELDEGYRTNMGGGLVVAGWCELLSQLAFMRAIGAL